MTPELERFTETTPTGLACTPLLLDIRRSNPRGHPSGSLLVPVEQVEQLSTLWPRQGLSKFTFGTERSTRLVKLLSTFGIYVVSRLRRTNRISQRGPILSSALFPVRCCRDQRSLTFFESQRDCALKCLTSRRLQICFQFPGRTANGLRPMVSRYSCNRPSDSLSSGRAGMRRGIR